MEKQYKYFRETTIEEGCGMEEILDYIHSRCIPYRYFDGVKIRGGISREELVTRILWADVSIVQLYNELAENPKLYTDKLLKKYTSSKGLKTKNKEEI